jgi:hypothetical protein
MIPISTDIASSVAGAKQAERAAVREQERTARKVRERTRRPGQTDEVEIGEVEHVEPVRNAKGNDQEETHEDRQAHGHYDAQGMFNPEALRSKIDFEG